MVWVDAGHVWPRVGKGKKKSKLGKPTRRRTAQRHAAPQTILMKGARKTMKTKQRLDQDVLNPKFLISKFHPASHCNSPPHNNSGSAWLYRLRMINRSFDSLQDAVGNGAVCGVSTPPAACGFASPLNIILSKEIP